MISSAAGKLAAPFLSAYVASKQGLEGYSQSLRRELLIYGVDVVIIGARARSLWPVCGALLCPSQALMAAACLQGLAR